MTQHTVTTVTPVLHRRSVIDATPVEMLEAQFGNVKGTHYERSFMCHKCQRVYPKSKMVFVDGIPYCSAYKHYEDALHDKAISESNTDFVNNDE